MVKKETGYLIILFNRWVEHGSTISDTKYLCDLIRFREDMEFVTTTDLLDPQQLQVSFFQSHFLVEDQVGTVSRDKTDRVLATAAYR